MSAPRERRIGRVRVAVRSAREALDEIAAMVARHEGGAVAMANQHTVNVAARDPKVAAALDRSLVLNDGIAIDLASRLLHGEPFPENLNGTDLTPRILKSLPPAGIYLVGSKPGVADRAMAVLAARYPQHRFLGAHHGFAKWADWPAIVTQIRASGADVVLLGMGHPYQDHWVHDFGAELPAVILSIGAFLDFTAGVVPRAPQWVRRSHLEWAYRLIREPRRMFGRYITGGAVFAGHLIRQKLGRD